MRHVSELGGPASRRQDNVRLDLHAGHRSPYAGRLGRRLAITAAAVITVLGLGATAAAAEPSWPDGAEVFTLTCGETTYNVSTTPGHDHPYTPYFDLDGTRTFVPVANGSFTVWFYDEAGNLLYSETTPGDSKPGKRLGLGTQECAVHGEFTLTTPGEPNLHGVFDGTTFIRA